VSTDAMHVYRCELTFWEHVFFSSREVSNFFQTEALLGNYALAYALGLARPPYHSDGPVRYKADLAPLNERGVYVTPGTIVGEPRFVLSQFNAQADTYWYAFTNNAIVVRPDDRRAVRDGARWRIVDPALGNRAVCYVLSHEPLVLPRYIRLGKWMSKVSVAVTGATAQPTHRDKEVVSAFLNPADLPHPEALQVYDLVSVHPVPLVRNAVLSGDFLQAPDGVWLPAGMRFGVEGIP